MSVPSKAAIRRYTAAIGLLSVGYAGLVFLAVYGLRAWPSSAGRYVVALAPTLPLILGLAPFHRMFRAYDELQRKIAGEALQTAFGVTAVATFAYGWLQFAGLPPINLTFIFPFKIFVFGVVYALRSRRYSL